MVNELVVTHCMTTAILKYTEILRWRLSGKAVGADVM